ncbi:type II toxin-antitoxin system RelE/ParE family toxin [Aeromicrobium sp. UC242_57]|uniref:type II toxin-antitoxin system RelE/ParE family toxin n=1 Tax=Aeromicrobium sp. UC242_57 TaxID=3374624 RepID=UPI00378F9EA8
MADGSISSRRTLSTTRRRRRVWQVSSSTSLRLAPPAPPLRHCDTCQPITGALASNPRRLGRQLNGPLFALYPARRGEYRVIYRIVDEQVVIEVVSIAHRRDAYR